MYLSYITCDKVNENSPSKIGLKHKNLLVFDSTNHCPSIDGKSSLDKQECSTTPEIWNCKWGAKMSMTFHVFMSKDGVNTSMVWCKQWIYLIMEKLLIGRTRLVNTIFVQRTKIINITVGFCLCSLLARNMYRVWDDTKLPITKTKH